MEIKEGFIICDEVTKKRIIKENKDFNNYIFLSYSELVKKTLGEFLKNSILILAKKYDYSYEFSKEIIDYLPYIEKKLYMDEKLDSLVTIKEYLIKNGYYKKDPYFEYRLSQFPITWINQNETKSENYIKDILSKKTNVNIINSVILPNKPRVLAFNNISHELNYVFSKIVKLKNNGVSYNKIFIINLDNSYNYLLKRLSINYNIPVAKTYEKNISFLPISKQFLNLCMVKDSFQEILNELDNNSKYYSSIMNIIIDYDLEEENPRDYISFFENELKAITFKEDKYEEMVQTKLKNEYFDDEYVFLVGMNLSKFPKIFKDDKFLNDEELELINLDSSISKNRIEKQKSISLLTKTKNIFCSYPKSDGEKELLKSNLIDELELEVIDSNYEYGYSRLEDDLNLGIEYSKFVKYKIYSNDLTKYDIKHLSYSSYNNEYKKIDTKLINDRFLDKPLKLSYSSIKGFFLCPFFYYADRILNLNEFTPNMAQRLGSYSHQVLEESYKPNFDFNKSVLNSTLEHAVDAKDKFFFKQMEEILSSLIEFNKEHENISMLNKYELEAHIEYKTDEFIFEGFIDKLLYAEIAGEIYAAIIDYKTGKDVISLDNVEDGFHLQLPSYMFLLSKYEKFKNKTIHIIGIYLQKVNIVSLDGRIPILEQRKKQFMLQGYSIDDKNSLALFDPSYNCSSYIKSMNTNKNGSFSAYAKIISEEKETEMIMLVEKLIQKANDEIKNACFSIEPKLINGKNESCTFCPYKDICYMKFEDIKELEYKPFKNNL